jgi:signal transduction histidine kinase
MVLILFGMGLRTGYAYRCLVRAMSSRVPELPIAAELSREVGGLRMTLSRLRGLHANHVALDDSNNSLLHAWSCHGEFQLGMQHTEEILDRYRDRLEDKIRAGSEVDDNRAEWETVHQIEASLATIHRKQATKADEEEWFFNLQKISDLEKETEKLQTLAAKLPSHLHTTLGNLADDVRLQYRALIITTWAVGIAALLILLFYIQLFYRWVFEPLSTLLAGSRRVAAGEFSYRIRLKNSDEMAELAEAMNDMTERFQTIRDDLDSQVQERTREVVRSEQLASVGFLAAGVAHEINNPLASIAMCAESLEARLRGQRIEDRGQKNEELDVIDGYLRMIQEEAFRCKEITEKLLDFSRAENTQRQPVELSQLIDDVIQMVGHLHRYRGRTIRFEPEEPVVLSVHPQEMKQVVLNLLTNALDSLGENGTVLLELRTDRNFALLTVSDDGCGMEPDILKHIFEPFYTRKRPGTPDYQGSKNQKGTGLGLSITYRIVNEHGGTIEATSNGPGLGSVFRVRLPLEPSNKKKKRRAA